MKSRTSSSNSRLFRELFKKQIWVFVLSCFGYFMAGPVLFLMRISEWEGDGLYRRAVSKAEMAEMFLQIIRADGSGNSRLMLPFILGTLAIGAVAAWNGFSYLHARSKTDLYHSLPVKREKLFLIHVLIGAADYLVPALLWFILSCTVAGARGIFTLQTGAVLLCSWLLGFIFFLYAFAVTSLAMMLTGRLLTGILGAAVFFFLDMLIGVLVLGFQSIFYHTMIEGQSNLFSGIGPKVLSPPNLAIASFQSWYRGNGWTMALAAAAAAVVLLALSLFIYLKRPSEAAGKAMAFFRAGECIKVVLSVTGALTFGLIFAEATGEHSDFWLIFGLLLGFVFFYALIQMIYTLDIRRCLSGKIAFAAGLVITFGITAICRFDLTGYDRYLPTKDQIDTIAVSVDSQVSCMYGSNIYEDARLEHAQMPCDDETYAILERFVSGNMIYHKTKGNYEEETLWKEVRVRLKNGKIVKRGYSMYRKDVEEELLALYREQAYREATWPVLAAAEDQLFGMKIFCNQTLLDDDTYYANEIEGTVLEKEDALRVFAALQEDFASVDPGIFLRESPFALIQCRMDLSGANFGEQPFWQNEAYGWSNNAQPAWTAAVPVYPSLKKTAGTLAELEIKPVQNPAPEEIKMMEIWEQDNEAEARIIVTEADRIRQLQRRLTLVCSIPNTRGGGIISSWTTSGQPVTVYVKTKNGEEMTCSGWLGDQEDNQEDDQGIVS